LINQAERSGSGEIKKRFQLTTGMTSVGQRLERSVDAVGIGAIWARSAELRRKAVGRHRQLGAPKRTKHRQPKRRKLKPTLGGDFTIELERMDW
jgi:hypothetical protein